LVFVANSGFFFAQSFIELRAKYGDLEENDERALPFIKHYIDKAKKKKIIRIWHKVILMQGIIMQMHQ
jgi:hypothetical protein